MTDAEVPHDEEAPEQPAVVDEQTGDVGGLLIVPGGVEAEVTDEDGSSAGLDVLAGADSDQGADEQAGEAVVATPAAAPTAAVQFTLDELVAEMAGVSAVAGDASSGSEPPVVQRVDPLAVAMSEAFDEAPAVEAELWTRLPFWLGGAVWALFVGALTYLLWPRVAGDLQSDPLYGLFVYGGTGLVGLGLISGIVVWTRARTLCALPDRGVVGRAIVLRALGWIATGVAAWVIAMIVLSLHSLGVIP
jgi:hypothetical protein